MERPRRAASLKAGAAWEVDERTSLTRYILEVWFESKFLPSRNFESPGEVFDRFGESAADAPSSGFLSFFSLEPSPRNPLLNVDEELQQHLGQALYPGGGQDPHWTWPVSSLTSRGLRNLSTDDAVAFPLRRPWEIETKVIKGRETKVYKALPPSLRDFWLSTKVRPNLRSSDVQADPKLFLQQFGERDYIVYQEERVTYAQAHVQVATIAELFRQRGVVKGDRVAIVMRNYPE